MGDFRATIAVDADISKAESQIKSLTNNKDVVKIKVELDKSTLSDLGKFKVPDVKAKVDFVVNDSALSKYKSQLTSLGKDKAFGDNKVNLTPKIDSSGITKVKGDLDKFKASMTQVQSVTNKPLKVKTEGTEKATSDADKLKVAYKELAAAKQEIFENKRSSSANRDETFINKNIRLNETWKTQLKEIAALKREASSEGELKLLNSRSEEIRTAAAAAGQTGSIKSMSDQFNEINKSIKGNIASIGKLAASYITLQAGVRMAKSMAKEVIAVDSAMIELRKVSDAPVQQQKDYFKQATASAKEYGASISEVINSAADWSRLGFDLKSAGTLTDVTTLFTKVGDNMTQESAQQTLLSTLKSFNIEAKDSLSVVDKINQVANTQPIDTRGISEALSRSSASMSAAGNSLEETIGLITAANSVVQSPEIVGTAFSTISMRIRGKHIRASISGNRYACCA